MKHILYTLFLTFLTIIMMAGCGGNAIKDKTPAQVDGTFRARALLTKAQQREFDQLYLEAIRQKEKENYDAEHELLQRALEINPNASEALYEQGMLQISLSPMSDSILVAEGDSMILKAYQLEPSNPYFRQELAELWMKRGKYKSAAELYEKIADEKPTTENLSVLLRLYEALKDYDTALKTIGRIENNEGVDETSVMEKYHIYTQMGKKEEALNVVNKLIEDNPQELRYKVLLGDIYMQDGNKEKGLSIYNDVLAADPENRLVKMAMLQYYIEEGDTVKFNQEMTDVMHDRKIESSQKYSLLQAYASSLLNGAQGISKETLFTHFREALDIPQDDSSLGELCAIYCQAANLPADSLQIALNAILRDNPEHLQARLQSISYLAKKEDYQGLAQLCHDGEKYNPDVILFYYYEGMTQYTLGHDAEALDAYERGIKQIDEQSDPEIAGNIYAALADLYHQNGRKAEAYAAYESSLKLQPDNVGCLNNYAYFLSLDNKDLDKASEMSKKTVDADPQNSTYLDTYAWILYCKKQYTQARIYIDQTIKYLPAEEVEASSTAGIYDHAGDIYFRCGDKTSAMNYWKHALSLSDDEDLTKQLNKKIKNKKL